MSKQLADPRINAFCRLINDGIEAWVKAGTLLVEITKDDPAAYDKIIAANPFLTFDILLSFERIGKKEIYPYLLVDGSPGARLLCALPYASQVKIYRSTVLVATKSRKNGFGQERKRVCDLTVQEANRVFDVSEIRSVADQIKLFPHPNYQPKNKATTPNDPHDDLNETPDHEVTRLLATANDAIVEARSTLARLKLGNNVACDRLITACLNYLGNLRYQVNDLLGTR